MALNATNVLVAVTGVVYRAAAGATLPTTPSATPDAAFKDLGYLSDDGIKEKNDVKTDEIVAWQNGATLRRTITGQTRTFSFTMVETKKDVLTFIRPGSPAITGAGPYLQSVMAVSSVRSALIIDLVDGTVHWRRVIPNCEITDFDDTEYKNGTAISYGVEVTAYPDATDVLVYDMSDSASWAA